MIHAIKRQLGHWSQSKARAALRDRRVFYAPVRTVAGLTTLGLWAAGKLTVRQAERAPANDA